MSCGATSPVALGCSRASGGDRCQRARGSGFLARETASVTLWEGGKGGRSRCGSSRLPVGALCQNDTLLALKEQPWCQYLSHTAPFALLRLRSRAFHREWMKGGDARAAIPVSEYSAAGTTRGAAKALLDKRGAAT